MSLRSSLDRDEGEKTAPLVSGGLAGTIGQGACQDKAKRETSEVASHLILLSLQGNSRNLWDGCVDGQRPPVLESTVTAGSTFFAFSSDSLIFALSF